jgi:UDP-N-acetylmuramoylalanine--D-glutamate ligase
MELKGKKVLVVGFGTTGIATTRFLIKKGAVVTITDLRREISIPEEFLQNGVRVETGRHDRKTFLDQNLIVVSPGVPFTSGPIVQALEAGIEVISEIELAYRYLETPLIAVTGTNGKTTTTSLLGEIFRSDGKDVFVGGNIGTPLIEYTTGPRKSDYVIAEISSFQLEGIKTFKPHIAVLLNITADHLDRYPSFNEYVDAKKAIFRYQDKSDFAVLNSDDQEIQSFQNTIMAERLFFSTSEPLKNGACYNGSYNFRLGDESVQLPDQGFQLQGIHNKENMLAALCVSLLCGIHPETVTRVFKTFTGLPHRMEFVDEIEGVRFYNDSKGTNVGACVKSLESLNPPLVLIAGGKDKGGSYEPLKELIRKKVKGLVLIGEARERIEKELGSIVATFRADSLESAVAEAFGMSDSGESILFSPACSSFDMFKSYAQRGDCFKDLVKGLKNSLKNTC